MCVVFSQSPAIPGSKRISPIASSTLSTSLPSNQGVEYSPRDPLFNPSSIPPEDWQSYPNIAQLFGVSTGLYSNAVASSSKVTLERVHTSHNTLDSVNAEPTVSVRALEKSPAPPAHGINGTSHGISYNSASEGQLLGMHSYPISYIYRCIKMLESQVGRIKDILLSTVRSRTRPHYPQAEHRNRHSPVCRVRMRSRYSHRLYK